MSAQIHQSGLAFPQIISQETMDNVMLILTPENLLLSARQSILCRFLSVLLQIGLVVAIELFDQQTHHTQD